MMVICKCDLDFDKYPKKAKSGLGAQDGLRKFALPIGLLLDLSPQGLPNFSNIQNVLSRIQKDFKIFKLFKISRFQRVTPLVASYGDTSERLSLSIYIYIYRCLFVRQYLVFCCLGIGRIWGIGEGVLV